MDAIIKATKKINNWRLNDCTLYVTLFPCNMCLEIIKASKINKIVYASDQNIINKVESDIDIKKIKEVVLENKCSNIILKKFDELRNNNKKCGKNVSRET